MIQVTQGLETIRLQIPEPLLNYDWDEDINANATQGETKGETVRLLKVCKMQGEMLQKASNWAVTPETITWMTLWTRNFNMLQGAISILECQVGLAQSGQDFALRLLWRPAFELWVTLNFIYNESVGRLRAQESEKKTIGQRLCAYLAWCLWNDKELAHKLTQGRRLDEFFNNVKVSAPEADELARGLELLWGDENTVDPAVDQETKRLVQINSLNERNQLRRWLQHEKLCDFEDQIRNKRPRSYFELVDPYNKCLADVLRSSLTDAGYPLYQEASALIHGSTFGQHMEVIGEHIFPRVFTPEDEVQQQASHIRRHCHFNAFSLLRIQGRMEGEGLA